jgi:hypothetical protein
VLEAALPSLRGAQGGGRCWQRRGEPARCWNGASVPGRWRVGAPDEGGEVEAMDFGSWWKPGRGRAASARRCRLRSAASEGAVTRSLQRDRQNLMLSSGVLAGRRWSRWQVNVKRARVIER